MRYICLLLFIFNRRNYWRNYAIFSKNKLLVHLLDNVGLENFTVVGDVRIDGRVRSGIKLFEARRNFFDRLLATVNHAAFQRQRQFPNCGRTNDVCLDDVHAGFGKLVNVAPGLTAAQRNQFGVLGAQDDRRRTDREFPCPVMSSRVKRLTRT